MNLLEIIKQQSQKDNVPIVRDDTLTFINKYINEHGIKTVLEIGTAYGYSAYAMSLTNVRQIVTIEKDFNSFTIASSFLKDSNKIMIINDNAFDYIPVKSFDLIFVDGPKSHQEQLINKYINCLNPNGAIIVDNIFLRKFDNIPNLTKNQKSLVKKVTEFRNWLLTNKKIKTKILDFDDGIAIILPCSS